MAFPYLQFGSRIRSSGFWNIFQALLSLTAVVMISAADCRATCQSGDVGPQIVEAIRNQDYSRAIQMADAALEETPKDPWLCTWRGIASQRTGDLEGAAKNFETALKFSPNYLPAVAGAAETNYKSGNDKAEPFLHRLLALKPDDPTAHAMLGPIAYRHHDCESAVADFDLARPAISSSAEALAQHGACLVVLEQTQKAVPVLNNALQLRPDDKRVRLALANAEYGSNDPREGLHTLEPLLDAAPREPDALAPASSCHEALGNTPKAVEYLRSVIVASPRNPQYYLDFASLCFNHSSFVVGVEMINAGLMQLPRSAPLYLARRVLNVQQAKCSEAQADFAKANEIDPTQNVASLARGLTLIQQDNFDGALRMVRLESKKHPDDAFLHCSTAEILAEQGATPEVAEFQKAMREGKEAVKLNPQCVLAHDTLAGLFLKSNQIKLAEHHAREALHLLPSDHTALYHLIQALRKSDDKKELPDLARG